MGEVFSQVGRQSDFPCQFRVVLVVVLLVVVMLLLCKFDRRKQKRANFFFNLNLYSSFFSWKGERGGSTPSTLAKSTWSRFATRRPRKGRTSDSAVVVVVVVGVVVVVILFVLWIDVAFLLPKERSNFPSSSSSFLTFRSFFHSIHHSSSKINLM